MLPERIHQAFLERRRSTSYGISLVEVLIVVAIVMLLLLLLAGSFQKHIYLTYDAQRKKDLHDIKRAFEDYYNDNQCYPDVSVLDACDTEDFHPYLRTVPCDPVDNTPYLYVPLEDQCDGYRVHAKLANSGDPIIEVLGCEGETGCGYSSEYVYGIAQGDTVFDPEGDGAYASPSPEPDPSTIYIYACDSSGVCNQFEESHPALVNCPVTFSTPAQCEVGCQSSENWCSI